MENEFWKYWKQRWPNGTHDEKVLRVSANYRETRAAFEAGYKAAEHRVQSDVCHVCHGERVVTDQHGRLTTCTFC